MTHERTKDSQVVIPQREYSVAGINFLKQKSQEHSQKIHFLRNTHLIPYNYGLQHLMEFSSEVKRLGTL